jgi:hypothetical protein
VDDGSTKSDRCESAATTDALAKVSAGIGRCSRQVMAMGRSPRCSTYDACPRHRNGAAPDFVAWRVADEEHHVRAELAVMQVPPATGESVDVVFSPHGANQPRPGIRSARVLGAI